MKEALIVSALESAEKAVALGLPEDKIILSCKVSAVQDLIQVYRELGSRCRYPLHLGLTEAGMGQQRYCSIYRGLSRIAARKVSVTPFESP